MGQAKKRGSFEQRREQAIARRKAEHARHSTNCEESIMPTHKSRTFDRDSPLKHPKFRSGLAEIAAALAGIPPK